MNNQSAQIESALVGSLIIDPDKIIQATEYLKVTDFTDERAQLAYSTILEDWQAKRPVSIVSVMSKHNNLTSYLSESMRQAYPPGVMQFAFDIADGARLRRVRTGIEAATKDNRRGADDILSDVMAVYNAEMKAGKKSPEIKYVMARVEEYARNNKEKGQLGIKTGFQLHDKLYIRYVPGHIWTIGGFTSVGKTATMVQMICNIISAGGNHHALVISTEMTEEQVVARIISNFTGVHSMRILSGNFHSAEEEDAVARVKDSLSASRLTIYDDIYQLEEIETAFRKADLQGGVDVGFIDYVQNCKWPGAKSQYQEQSEMAKRFQVLAKDVRATLICLSQVSNDVGRGNTDQLELKGAGEWAAVSDVGIMLTRHKTEKHRLKQAIKKNRHGALGECELEYRDYFTRIEEMVDTIK